MLVFQCKNGDIFLHYSISFFWEKNQRRTLLCKIAAVVGHWSQVNSLLWKSFAAILLWKQIPLLIFFSWKHEKKCKKESEVGNSWRWSADGQGSISMKKEVSWQVERKEEIGIAFNPNFHLPLMIRIKPLNKSIFSERLKQSRLLNWLPDKKWKLPFCKQGGCLST